MQSPSGGWLAVVEIVGPIIFVAVLLWALFRNRKSRPSDVDRTEAATRDLYREEDAEHRGEDDRGP